MSLHESLAELAGYHATLAQRSDAAFLVLAHLVILLGRRDPQLRKDLSESLHVLRDAAREDDSSGVCGEAIDKIVELLVDGEVKAPLKLIWSEGRPV